MISRPWPIKEKIDKMDFMKIKNFCNEKDTFKRMKRHTTQPWRSQYFLITFLTKDLY